MIANIKHMYKIVDYGKNPIERVEVVKETASFVTYIDRSWRKPVEHKEKKEGNFFNSFEEARSAWEQQLRMSAEYHRQHMERYLSKAGNAKGLRNPYEEAA